MSEAPREIPRDRLELLATTRRTFVMRLKSELMRIESDIAWCKRYMPNQQSLPGDEEAAEILRQLIALKERCLSDLDRMLEDDSQQGGPQLR